MARPWLYELSMYLPDISSITGIIFYSFVTYIFLFLITRCLTNVIEEQYDYDKYYQKKIIKAREQKAKEAEKMLNRIDPQIKQKSKQQ